MLPILSLVRFGRVARAGAAVLALAAAGIAPAAVVFSDGAMAIAGFSAMPLFASPGITVVSSTTSAVGNPPDALKASFGRVSGQSDYSYQAGYLYAAFTYTPGVSGAVSTLDVSLDRGADFRANDVPVPGLTLTGRPLIFQGGKYFMAVSAPVVPTGMPTLDTIAMPGLTAADFSLFDFATGLFDGSSHPDFAGSTMQFGFAMRALLTGRSPTEVVQLDAYADNFRLQVNPAQAVPEPASWALAGLALLALAWRGSAGARPGPGRGQRRLAQRMKSVGSAWK